MEKSRILRLINMVELAAKQTGIDVTPRWVEDIALGVFSAMDQSTRVFHQVEHAFDVAEGQEGLGIFAALFHDVVYLQVDGGIPDCYKKVLKPYISVGNYTLAVLNNLSPVAHGVVKLFGFDKDSFLTYGSGVNEMLSALCALELMSDVLSKHQLLELVAYIEATIPFRDNAAFRELAEKLKSTAKDFGIRVSAAEVDKIVKKSVAFANGDVKNFASVDTGAFLSETWKLYAEMNPSLRRANSFYIQSYRTSLVNGLEFFLMLQPHKVFHSYKQFPDEMTITKLTSQTTNNLVVASNYIKIKLFTITVVEAIAACTGGDAPISLLLGESYESNEHIEHYLDKPKFKVNQRKAKKNLLYKLLAQGRSESGFEIASSPLSTYFHDCLGEERVLELVADSQEYIDGNLKSKEFLGLIDESLIDSLLIACAKICPTRAHLLEALSKSLASKKVS